MGTSGWQHRFRVDPDPGVGSDDQAPDGGWLQGALTAVRAAYTLSPIVQIDSSNQLLNPAARLPHTSHPVPACATCVCVRQDSIHVDHASNNSREELSCPLHWRVLRSVLQFPR